MVPRKRNGIALEVVGSTAKKTAASPVTCCYGEDIHVMGGTEREFKQLTTSLANRERSYARRECKALVSSCQEVKALIEMNEEQLEEVRSFKYSGAIIYTERTSYEKNQSSDFMTTTSMARQKRIRKIVTVSTAIQIKPL